MSLLVAHQGGWDEVLLFVAPIAAAFLLIRGLERRARARRDDQGDSEQKTVP